MQEVDRPLHLSVAIVLHRLAEFRQRNYTIIVDPAFRPVRGGGCCARCWLLCCRVSSSSSGGLLFLIPKRLLRLAQVTRGTDRQQRGEGRAAVLLGGVAIHVAAGRNGRNTTLARNE